MIQRRLLALLPAAALLAACAAPLRQPDSITDTLAHNPELSTFSSLVSCAGLSDSLRSGGPSNVFAPTNTDFKAVPGGDLQPADRARLSRRAGPPVR